MEDTLEFFRSGGVDVSTAGRRRWPDDLKARIVAETLEPGATVREVAGRYCVRANRISEWRRLAKDGKLVLPAVSDPPGFAPLLLCDKEPSCSPPETASAPETPSIEIVVGEVSIRLNGNASAAQIAEIVRAVGCRT
ncbi:transposase [Thalassobacter stenotrophicus]|uniref:IS66-like element accessory protein TnpA n=1 Tax=Thalassobacter stenotrophicus TaxID=266809 RepID=UPI0022A9116A|nr:transposase [Thalassobacter stenotrophicus]UYP66710.1 transposase [Thalassobacter stenotrophicus]UYP67360.1 transposase [Thalassobacter stenotrophicus]UYP68327.1 transposase [Thalassobacter stenotrophicus]UYP68996.1 transposase [Thalassobacter stenotrophicus]UYP69012.1 transposase [Thalassobacter stenotrophicus]